MDQDFLARCSQANIDILRNGKEEGLVLSRAQTKEIEELWKFLSKKQLIEVCSTRNIEMPDKATKPQLIDQLLELHELLPVPQTKKRTQPEDDDDDDDEKANKAAEDLYGESESDEDDDLDDSPAPPGKSSFSLKQSLELKNKMSLALNEMGHYTPKEKKVLCLTIMSNEYLDLTLLLESEQFADREVKLANGDFTINKKAKRVLTEPLLWSVCFLRYILLLCICFPHLFHVISRYHATLLSWFQQKRYPVLAIIEYDKRLRLQHQEGGPSRWVLSDLNLMAQYLFSGSKNSSPSTNGSSSSSSSSKRNKKNIICYKWRDRKCKDASCEYRHSCDSCPGVDVHDKSICPRWLQLKNKP